jgi:electron transfer flavoprotein alpha subunit
MTMILVFVESPDDELSRQALAFGLRLGAAVEAVTVDGVYAPAAWALAIVAAIEERNPAAVIGPGTDRGNELLAHVAAVLDQPMAANCVSLTPGDPASVTRMRWGGSLLEEASLHGSPLLATVAPHALAAAPADAVAVDALNAPQDGAIAVLERLQAPSAGVSLADAEVVVSGGRGVGSAEGFGAIEELAELLGGAVGCSRAVTMAGWRPHTDQVGQTGTKVSPELYIACGISGATQHMAGCKGAKHLLAINSDPEASIFASADYGVIGDVGEVVPAISAEIRKAKGV